MTERRGGKKGEKRRKLIRDDKGAVPGVFGLHNMRRGGLRFRKNSLTPRNSLTSLRTAQGLVCDAGDVL